MHSPHIQTITHSLHANRTLGQVCGKHDHGRNTRIRALRTLLTLTALSLPLGCAVAESESADDFRSFTYWEDVQCDEYGDGCFAKHDGSADLWTSVIDVCELGAMINQGTLTPMRVQGWDRSTCDPGGVPTGAPDVQCFWIQNTGRSICYAGGDGWYAIARPACENEFDFSLGQWSSGSCATTFGFHNYDAVRGSATDSNYALGTIVDEAYHLRPTCWLDSELSMVPAVAGTCFMVEG